MSKITPPENSIFTGNAPSLAGLRDRVAHMPDGTSKRDMLSALDAISRLSSRPLKAILANPRSIRELFASLEEEALPLSRKRYANIKSSVSRAFAMHGQRRQPVTKRILLLPAWSDLLASVPCATRSGVNRLAAFCSSAGIQPKEVTNETLTELYNALSAEETLKDPRTIIVSTVVCWKRLKRDFTQWPRQDLTTPFDHRRTVSIPLADFPQSFRNDLLKWKQSVANPDPIDEDSILNPLRPATIRSLESAILRFASTLVRSGSVRIARITKLAVLLEEANFKAGFKHSLERMGNKKTANLANFAASLLNVGRHYCRLNPARLEELKRIARRLQPAGNPDPLTARNRKRLGQFDHPDNVDRLINFPATERARALKEVDPLRQSLGMQKALLAALLIHCKLRILTLRTLEMKDFRRLPNGRYLLFIPGHKVKNGVQLEFRLLPHVGRLLEEYIQDHRPRLPGSSGPYLFSSKNGGPKSECGVRTPLMKAVRRHTGLVMNPHLFRHAMTKVVIEKRPDLMRWLSKQLGHKNLNTTSRFYMGTEQLAAGLEIDRVLMGAAAVLK